jgi:tetratricopeptide (TPR) repeat protein
MQRFAGRFLSLVPLVCGALVLAPLAGCGGTKKKPPMTFAERLKKAKADATPGGPARELAKVARSQFKSGDKAGALQTLADARKTIADDADAVVFAPRLVDIAASFASMADKRAAREAADEAVTMSDRIGDPVTKVDVLAKVGAIYGARDGGLGESSKAKDLLARAAEIAGGEDVADRFRPQALAAVALGYANANLADQADAIIEKLEGLAESLDARPKAEALAAAANVRAKRGEKDKAEALLDDATKAAKAVDGSANKTFALIAVANALKTTGNPKAAIALAAEAEKSAGKIGDAEQQKEAMLEVRTLQASLK